MRHDTSTVVYCPITECLILIYSLHICWTHNFCNSRREKCECSHTAIDLLLEYIPEIEHTIFLFCGSYLSALHLQLQTHSACILCRKAYHPFVWNSLRPYADTTEIDYLIAMVRACSFSAKLIGISLVSQQPQFIGIYVLGICTTIVLYIALLFACMHAIMFI